MPLMKVVRFYYFKFQLEIALSVVGENELIYGLSPLATAVSRSNFTWVSANLVDSTIPSLWHHPPGLDVLPFKIINFSTEEHGNTCLGVLGLTLTNKIISGVHFHDPILTIKRYAPIISQSCRAWIVAAHIGDSFHKENEKIISTIAIGAADAGINIPLIINSRSNENIKGKPFYLVPGTITTVSDIGNCFDYIANVVLLYYSYFSY
jgi:2',3'-cyclic-nucleotide 2'-phosphodiesterase (5'-nucleotidase family)